MKDKIIFTALFGNYEELKEPTFITPGWKYICFTDQEIESINWAIIQSQYKEKTEDARSVARWFKIMKQEGDQSIWIDASFQINCNLDDFWNEHFKAPFTAINHPVRNCMYKEAWACMKRKLGGTDVVKQMERYRDEGLPEKNGLISSGILLRNNSEQTKEFCDLWWKQVLSGSIRDQIGFAYAAWKMPIVNYFDYDYRVRQEFIYSKHYHNR
jgi:hypothetical protein